MDVDIKNKAAEAAESAKSFLGDAKDKLKDGFDQVKQKAQDVAENAKSPEGRQQLKDKANGVIDSIKDKTADVLRAGAEGAKKLADKIDD